MWLKFGLGTLFLLSLLGAFVLEPGQPRVDSGSKSNLGGVSAQGGRGQDGQRLRLITWNIGNGDLESETRAHAEDLPAVAQVILENDADAVALQELTGEEQLKLLLAHLKNRYRGYVCSRGSGDRVEAVLVKDRGDQSDPAEQSGRGAHDAHSDRGVRFNAVPAGERFAAAATFRLQRDLPEIVFISAHADAFNASRRRIFTEDMVDWARGRAENVTVLIAGDFNFEVSTRTRTNLFTDDAKHDSESYAYLLKYFRDLGRDAGATSINDRRIDYVFGPAGTVSMRRAEVLRGSSIGRMDHWPLLVEVTL